MTVKLVAWLAAGSFSVGTVGWGAHEYLHDTFAERGAVLVAGAKADFVIDRQMAATASEIGYLERKQNKTQDDRDRLRYLREQYEQMRRVRSGR